ncbi:MAG: 30S ribosomal protein S15 [Tissierellia bacterium]|nr:30S ribosomal protein S15 [Bacillota bacterium]NLL22188.1 30S ribosomal protein S15 [Tissierellia bacterium]
MEMDKEKKQEIISQFREHENDSGSSRVQVAVLTTRINELNDHLKRHPKDHHTRRGLLKLVGRRRNLLNYIRKRDIEEYRSLIEQLKLRK